MCQSSTRSTTSYLFLAKKKFGEGMVAIPWTFAKIFALALLIYFLAGNYWGNSIRCAIFDVDGCSPRLEVKIERIPLSQKSQLSDEEIINILDAQNDLVKVKKNPGSFQGISVLQIEVTIQNIGVSSVDSASLTPIFHPGKLGSGYLLSHNYPDCDDDNCPDDDEKKAIEVTSSDFVKSSSMFVNEVFEIKFIGAVPKEFDNANTELFHLIVSCGSCQVKHEKYGL